MKEHPCQWEPRDSRFKTIDSSSRSSITSGQQKATYPLKTDDDALGCTQPKGVPAANKKAHRQRMSWAT